LILKINVKMFKKHRTKFNQSQQQLEHLKSKPSQRKEAEKDINLEDDDDFIEIIDSSAHSSLATNRSYEPSIWTREFMLKKYDKKHLYCHFPHGLSEYGELTFIGKARIKLISSGKITEKIGQAKKSTQKLEMCHMNKVFEFDKFLILNFDNLKNSYWHEMNLAYQSIYRIPLNALRLGYDTVSHSVLYAGRSLTIKNCKLIGYISGNENQFLVAHKNQQIILSDFEILCLKSCPVSLKEASRKAIREFLNHKNSNISKLKYYLDSTLIKYVKYSNCLRYGSELRPIEYLLSKNEHYKLSLEPDGRLLLYINEHKDFLFLYDNVDSLWFYELGIVVCFKDGKSASFLKNLDNMNANFKGAKMYLLNSGCIKIFVPNYEYIIFVNFREDLGRNSNRPSFEFVYYFEKNQKYKIEKSSLSDTEEEYSSSDSSCSDSSCSESSKESSDSNKMEVKLDTVRTIDLK
jgi:hypothetical protein